MLGPVKPHRACLGPGWAHVGPEAEKSLSGFFRLGDTAIVLDAMGC